MAVANTKSLVVTARDATPNLLTPYGGVVKTVGGTVATLAADDDGSVYRMCRLSSSARILGVRTTHGTMTSGTDWDFGAYQTAANGGAVVDKDALVDGADLSTARLTPTTLPFQAGASYGKYLWEILGLSSDPLREYDLCWTANTVGSAATDVTTYVEYLA